MISAKEYLENRNLLDPLRGGFLGIAGGPLPKVNYQNFWEPYD